MSREDGGRGGKRGRRRGLGSGIPSVFTWEGEENENSRQLAARIACIVHVGGCIFHCN